MTLTKRYLALLDSGITKIHDMLWGGMFPPFSISTVLLIMRNTIHISIYRCDSCI